ncbi:MAG: rhomboid family intramembrane serine protease [Sedimentitalea sp.]
MSPETKDAIRHTDQADLPWRPAIIVVLLISVTIAIELCLSAADAGLIGSPRWRGWAYQYGAFWSGLLDNWRANYPAQPWTMFLSYQVLHAGWSHLIGNMIVLYLMGRILVPRTGQFGFLFLYIASGIGGGLGVALLNDAAQPVVGASGALFGLVGAWKWQDLFWRNVNGYSRRRLLLDVLGLILLNVLLWAVQDGQLAWEAHLGGFLTGWLVATLMIPRSDSAQI